ncbi:MAG: DsbA family oxidoreductase [Muribaculaceae bacterium]|nr:DsbA family oxidoreductase [Muribaculaceae bacterium]
MDIKVWFDFQCPFCYMGLKRLEGALTNPDLPEPVEVVYKSYQLNPDLPEVPVETMTEHFMSDHDMTREQAEKQMERITRMAERAGIEMNFADVQVCNTMDAHRLIKFAAKKLSPWRLKRLVFHLFEANFVDNLRLSDRKILTELASAAGLDTSQVSEMLQSDDYREAVMHDREELEGRENFDVIPYFLLEDKTDCQGVVSEKGLHDAIRETMQDS